MKRIPRESPQRSQYICGKSVDKTFAIFAANLKDNFSRIKGKINKLMDIYIYIYIYIYISILSYYNIHPSSLIIHLKLSLVCTCLKTEKQRTKFGTKFQRVFFVTFKEILVQWERLMADTSFLILPQYDHNFSTIDILLLTLRLSFVSISTKLEKILSIVY